MSISITNSISTSLPSYRKPPVNEVVCGVRFLPPDKLKIPHIGLLWDKFRRDYPNIEHAVPIASSKGELLIDETTGVPLPRVWFINKAEDQLIQLQFDRFYYNWRRKQNDYPRYPHVIESFSSAFSTIDSFINDNDLGVFNPLEYELSYINHIPKGLGWNTLEDLPKLFKDLSWSQHDARFLPNPTKISWKMEFPITDKMGNLTVTLKQATRVEDKVQLFMLQFTARGIDESGDKKAFRKWFDVAHEWIVRGFTDLTTNDIHQVWEIEK